MNKKEVLIGFIIGLIANTTGTLLYIIIFSKLSIIETYKVAVSEGHVGSLLALGAILNLAAFFGFLKIKRDLRAKGVLIATLMTALLIMYYKVF
ncbi:hypothetical protein KO500_03420 [Cellulophaga baltica]|uniref:hypothetical protein n=1 Tax=Cellulophaga TaxID=104264 RepID=UPI001C0777BB|nr:MULTISPECIES: hypothetical protein [Cellulophaga]MBU2995463.1 hypothetical protein [Cellulophaga baltica]MDO6766857.1 hypothetical protein [Cellulophaga sp. 1_MG-2023]